MTQVRSPEASMQPSGRLHLLDGVGDEALDRFRSEVAQWYATHVPADWRDRMTGASEAEYLAFQRWWLEELRQGGYLAPNWPAEWGGGGFSLLHQVVIAEEAARAGAPRLGRYLFGLFHAAATLFAFGTDEQRAQHLPAILRGETWCQGFSEPEAGSDLAGLRTRAVLTGDAYVVNGQKIWSSDAVGADFCLLLARTDPSAPKRRGISYFILDMHQPGIDVRPIRQSTGEQEFNEVFLTDVQIPVADRIGAEGEGWSIAQRTLSEERGTTIVEMSERLRGSVQLLREDVRSYVRSHEGTSLASDAAQQFAMVHSEAEVLRLLCHQMIRDLVVRGGAGPESSIIKLYYSEILQRVTNLGVRMAGLPGQLARPLTRGVNWESGDWMIDYVGSWGWTIGGGTSEILKTVVAERVLEMPREPGVQ